MARDGAFSSRRGSGEGSLHCHTHPPQNTNNSRNELNDLLQSQDLTHNDPSKRTGPSAQNEAHRRRGGPCGRPCGQDPARVVGTEAGRVPQPQADRAPLCAGPTPKTENSRNELNDLLQSKGLNPNDPSKRTGSSAPNEPPGVHGYTSGHRSGSRRPLSGSADRRVCGSRYP